MINSHQSELPDWDAWIETRDRAVRRHTRKARAIAHRRRRSRKNVAHLCLVGCIAISLWFDAAIADWLFVVLAFAVEVGA